MTNKIPDSTDSGSLLRRQPVQRRGESTRNRIVEAAVSILERDGIRSFSMRQVAAAAGVSVGSVYEYFPSRQALLFRIAEQRLSDRLQVLDSVLVPGNPEMPLEDLVQQYLQALQDAGLYSRLDLEIRVAEESDPQLGRYTARYQEELTRRYIQVWKRYGSPLSGPELEMLAQYIHEMDLVSMKLQLRVPAGEQAPYRFITRKVAHVLAKLALEPLTEAPETTGE